MEIIGLEFDGWTKICFSLNWIAILALIILAYVSWIVYKKAKEKLATSSMIIEEVKLGIGQSSVKIGCNKKNQEIAYKLWVELSTRKIGIPFDMQNDVVVEIYNSWYEFFKVARELLKEVPVDKIAAANDLIVLTEKVLNKGLRPHLTTWQAKFRKWYDNALSLNNEDTPQELQKKYPLYDELMSDLLQTNQRMLEYENLMKRLAFMIESKE